METNETSIVEHRGCRLAYNVRGDGLPVLLIQGVGVHGDGWRPQVDELTACYRCLTFDNRGMNRSQPVGVPLSIEQMAEDALVLMDKQGWKSAPVVGHSMGGLTALHLALSARERVRSLSLLCTFACGRDATRLSPWMIWTGLRTRVGTRPQRRRAFLKLVLPPDALANSDLDAVAERLAPFFGHDLANQPRVAMKQLSAMGRYDATSRLGELSGLPTLVVSAFHDRIARPEYGRALAAGIPGARYVELADAAHGVPIERPEQINNLLLEHLAQAETASTNGKANHEHN
ncbi:MAG: alpha/beta hydrolase [Verrucomicrobiales bacterium]|nr:alpha/beta hydrolase [Verrucomicrobiales bacterium]